MKAASCTFEDSSMCGYEQQQTSKYFRWERTSWEMALRKSSVTGMYLNYVPVSTAHTAISVHSTA